MDGLHAIRTMDPTARRRPTTIDKTKKRRLERGGKGRVELDEAGSPLAREALVREVAVSGNRSPLRAVSSTSAMNQRDQILATDDR